MVIVDVVDTRANYRMEVCRRHSHYQSYKATLKDLPSILHSGSHNFAKADITSIGSVDPEVKRVSAGHLSNPIKTRMFSRTEPFVWKRCHQMFDRLRFRNSSPSAGADVRSTVSAELVFPVLGRNLIRSALSHIAEVK